MAKALEIQVTYFVVTQNNVLHLYSRTCPVCKGVFHLEDLVIVRHVKSRFKRSVSYFHRLCWKKRHKE